LGKAALDDLLERSKGIVANLTRRLTFHTAIGPGCSCGDCDAIREANMLVAELEGILAEPAKTLSLGARWIQSRKDSAA
jgi:hypothetical protein